MNKQLRLSINISTRKNALAALYKTQDDFEVRRAALEKRYDELPEEPTDTTEADMAAIDTDLAALEKEVGEADIDKKISTLEQEIGDLEKDLQDIKDKIPDTGGTETRAAGTNKNIERVERNMIKNRRLASILTDAQRTAFNAIVERDDVKNFLTDVRGMQQRGVTNARLTVPDNVVGLLRDVLHRYSKLIKYVNLKPIKGTARERIIGTIPEGVWTEMIGTSLNELSFAINQATVDGYMVGGFIPIHNSELADSDINLLAEIIDMLGQSIGIAIDKAIPYGKGVNMPMGIITRLAQTSKPTTWDENIRGTWKDLRGTNIGKTSSASLTDVKLYQELILMAGKIKSNYATGEKFWMMSSSTYNTLLSKTLTFNAAGAIVTGQTKTMPIIGGEIITLDFMPDNDIIGGYGSLYLLAEREGNTIESSEHVRFLQNETVTKGYARYDGLPVIGEAFVAINIAATNVTTEISFAPDTANTPEPEVTP